ncbi:MAG: tRNA uridine-5-carboxymethylaminomethyl(34) synthesis GTPase MnmE [Lachnospiraceae bacterium]|nr:tRNA uridine-5-carboxymethylaminomethyl(34) synthesis GTPase MnmE [Lachnospiraceae bacterium]
MKTDTIAAIATAMSNSGIGIIRISGPDAIEVADKIYRSKNNKKKLCDQKTHTIHYGYIYDGDELIDEVMVAIMKAPNSFTAEDTVEIDCHGGMLVMKKILEAVLKNGGRAAEPGEFSKRAFLNGRIDLTKAEAIMDLISSQNDYALKSSVNQLKGSIYTKIKELREKIIYEIAFIESALDDPEHISTEGYSAKLTVIVDDLIKELTEMIRTFDNGKVIKEGIHVVILGKPNAGKSSLLNKLLGEEKAIVTDIAGTTRDVLEQFINLDGIGIHLVDTAGIRETEDVVERIGVDRAKDKALDADLIIYVVDSSRELDNDDQKIIDLMADKKSIILLNKSDLNTVITMEDMKEIMKDFHEDCIILNTSMTEDKDLKELEDAMKEMFIHGKIDMNEEVTITNIRHKEALMEAKNSLQLVKQSLMDEMPEDFYSIDLMNAYGALGGIIGEEVGEDLVNEIFSKFCMGK